MSELVDVWFTFWNALMWSVAVLIRISLWARRGTGNRYKGRGGEGRERKMGIDDGGEWEDRGRKGREGKGERDKARRVRGSSVACCQSQSAPTVYVVGPYCILLVLHCCLCSYQCLIGPSFACCGPLTAVKWVVCSSPCVSSILAEVCLMVDAVSGEGCNCEGNVCCQY